MIRPRIPRSSRLPLKLAWIMLILLGGVFVYAALFGPRGLSAYRDVEARIAVQKERLDALQARRRALLSQVRGLRASAIDPWLIEKFALSALGRVPADAILLGPVYDPDEDVARDAAPDEIASGDPGAAPSPMPRN